MTDLTEVLQRAGKKLPRGYRTMLRPLLQSRLLDRFADRLGQLHASGGQESLPEPCFESETSHDIADSYRHFFSAMNLWDEHRSRATANPNPEPSAVEGLVDEFVASFQNASVVCLLRILGQRRTSGSVSDHRAFPPEETVLLASASTPVSDKTSLSHSARALTKHAGRGESSSYWGEPTGSDDEKNQTAIELVQRILQEATWWNVFRHGNFGTVYEVRASSGHGVRWSVRGDRFIGFVDPFVKDDLLEDEGLDAGAESSSAGTTEDAESVELLQRATAGSDPIDHSSPLQELTRNQLLERIQAGETDFRRSDLRGQNLSNLDLVGLDFSGSDFRTCKLFKTSFEGSRLTECDLSAVYLAGTQLSGATLRRANLRKCRADGVHWCELDLENARLDEINLRGARLEAAMLRRTKLGGADLSDAVLDHCRMYGANLEAANLNGAYLNHCRLTNARLANATAVQTRFDRCTFDSADLHDIDCSAGSFRQCHFVEASVANATLSEVDLCGAKLDRANLSATRLDKSRLQHASLVRADCSRANLQGAELSNATLEQADLSRADLRNATLDGANLKGADLTGADVVDTKVSAETQFEATKTVAVDFGTNWLMRQQVMESAHNLTIRHFRRKNPVLGFFWWALLNCGKQPGRLLVWGILIVFFFAGMMALRPSSFDFGQPNPTFLDHVLNSMAVFVTLDLAVDKGLDMFGRCVMLAEMLLSYLMLGFLAGLFSAIFPKSPE